MVDRRVLRAIPITVVLLIVVVGAFYIKAANYSPYIPPAEPAESETGLTQSLFSFVTGAEGSNFGWYGLLAAASLVFFAFIGFDIVATTAEEARNPQRDLPRGMIRAVTHLVTVEEVE